MGSLKDIRNRINSITSTRQITSTMKMVSAAKLRKAQQHITQLRPYADKLYEIFQHLHSDVTIEDNKYAEQRELNRILLVVITSNRGLCGSFNHNVTNKAIELLSHSYPNLYDNGAVDLLTIGKTGYTFLRSKGYGVVEQKHDIYDNLTFPNVASIAEEIMDKYLDYRYDRVELIYNSFKNAANQVLKVEQFLPIDLTSNATEASNQSQQTNKEFIIEPSKTYVLNELVPKSLKIQFFKALLDSYASEHGARMTAMQQATDNATELLEDLRLQYNKARQAAITSEILDIINGAEALKG